MKKIIRYFVFCLLILSVSITGLFFGTKFSINSKTSSAEQLAREITVESDVSIFIRKPSFSVFYNKKLYFIDEADKLLKSYDTENSVFSADYLDLSSLNIIDASFIENSWYLLTKVTGETEDETKNQLVKIDLNNFEIVPGETFSFEIEKEYTSIFAQKVRFDEKDFTLITFSAIHKNSVVALVDEESGSIDKIELKFDSSNSSQNTIMNSLKKTITYQDSSGKLFIIYVGTEIAYFNINSIDNLKDYAGTSSIISSMYHTSIPDDMLDLSSLMIMNVGIVNINSIDYIAIAYSTNTNSQHIKYYKFNLDNNITPITYKASSPCENAKWINFNASFYSYVNEYSQKLYLASLESSSVDGDTEISSEINVIDNPKYNIEYFSADNFIYKKAIVTTELYSDPWGANSNIFISKGTNIIQIGKAKLVGGGSEIKDYDYCLYTYSNSEQSGVNRCGFVKSNTLEEKAEITPKEAGYKERVSIWPRTVLYSLPTTIIAGKIGGDNSPHTPERLMIIEDNSEIEVLDVLSNYVANNIQMIKVKVNKNQVGYIDAKCIRQPSDVKNFVITNATIKNDDTTVYLNASLDSTTLSFKLDKGKTVRINGARNTKTGFTSITFNDEYGNEFSGYIETDYLKSDSWSTLQIIGCILIAINIGLLILILIYKKNHLGNRGQKIEKE